MSRTLGVWLQSEGRKAPLYFNQYLYHTQLLWQCGQLSCGTFRREPATRWFDESLATLRRSNEQFAR